MLGRFREAGLLVGAQVAGQIALLLVIPVLTRIFSPAEFGAYQIALAISIVIQPIATLRLEFIIPVTRSDELAARRYRLAMTVIIAGSLAIAMVGAAYFVWGGRGSGEVLVMLALLAVVNAWTVIDNARLIRGQQTKRLALRNFLAGFLAAVLQLVVGLFAPHVLLLAVALLVTRAIAILVTRSRSAAPSAPSGEIEPDDRYSLRRGATTVVAGVISNSSIYGLTLLGGAMFGASVSGQIAVAQRITSTPVSLAGQAVSQYFQTRASAAIRARSTSLRTLTIRFALGLAVLISPVVVAMIVLGPVLAVPILGEGWQPAGWVVLILAVPTGLQLVVAPTIPLLVMLNHERLLLGMQVVRLTVSLAAGAVPGLLTGDFLMACVGYASAATAAYLLTLGVTIWVAGRNDQANESRDVDPR